MPITSPQDFRAAASKRRKTTDVEIEGVGAIRLRALSAGEAQRFQAEIKKAATEGRDAEDLAFPLVARSWIGDDGSLWMPEADGEAFARDLDPETYTKIVKAVLVLNGLDTEAVAVAEKNSEPSRAASTPIGSPESSATPTSI